MWKGVSGISDDSPVNGESLEIKEGIEEKGSFPCVTDELKDELKVSKTVNFKFYEVQLKTGLIKEKVFREKDSFRGDKRGKSRQEARGID